MLWKPNRKKTVLSLKPLVSCNYLYPLLQLLQEGSRLNPYEGTEERANCTSNCLEERKDVFGKKEGMLQKNG